MWRLLVVLVTGCAFQVPAAISDGGPSDGPSDAGSEAGTGDAPSDAAGDAPLDAPLDAAPAELTARITASNDDALQDPDGSMLVAYPWMSLYGANHWGALRFAIPNVERGATIVAAYLEVVVDSTGEDSPRVVIKTASANNPGPLTTTDDNISARAVGTASVAWSADNIGAGTRRSPSLTVLVQERVDAANWAPGEHMLFVLDTQNTTAQFEIRQYDYATGVPIGSQAARLTIRYVNP